MLAMGTALLAGLIVFTLFGVGLQCLCLRRLYKPLASWRTARSRLVALLIKRTFSLTLERRKDLSGLLIVLV